MININQSQDSDINIFKPCWCNHQTKSWYRCAYELPISDQTFLIKNLDFRIPWSYRKHQQPPWREFIFGFMWGTLRESETSTRQSVAKAVAKADVIGRIGREELDMTDMFDDFCRLRHVDGFSAKASNIVRSIAIACWLKRCAAFKQLAGPKMVQLVIQMGYPFSLWMVDQLMFSKRALSSEFGDPIRNQAFQVGSRYWREGI